MNPATAVVTSGELALDVTPVVGWRMPRYTDDQVEAWVSPESRMLTFRDGSIRPHTMTALAWHEFDLLVDHGHTPEWLIRLAYDDAQQTRRPFELLFPSYIATVRDARRARGLP